jgi:hypothetical protein
VSQGERSSCLAAFRTMGWRWVTGIGFAITGCAPWASFLTSSASAEAYTSKTNVAFTILALFGSSLGVWFALFRATALRDEPLLATFSVVAWVSAVQSVFAQWYYGIALAPGAFNQPLTRFDASYFTISTATTAGVTSIAAQSTYARTVVMGHVVLSLFIVVAALGIAFDRYATASAQRRSEPAPPSTDDRSPTPASRVLPNSTADSGNWTRPIATAVVALLLLRRWRRRHSED